MTQSKDRVDDVAAEWGRERPDLDVFPIQIFGRLQLGGRLTDAFYARSVGPFGLRLADFFVLSELRRAGPPTYSRPPSFPRCWFARRAASPANWTNSLRGFNGYWILPALVSSQETPALAKPRRSDT